MKLHTADSLIENCSTVIEMAKLSTTESNDFKAETTTFIFQDGSCVVDNNGELTAHFSIESVSIIYVSEQSKEESDYLMAKFDFEIYG